MKTAALFLVRVYQGAIGFYPRRFRAEYGEEMLGVYTRICR